MGVLEKKLRTRRMIGAFQIGMLVAVAVGGVVLVAAMTPNALQLLKYFPGYKKGARFNHQTKSALGKLAEKGLVIFVEHKGKRVARLTEAGEQTLALKSNSVSRPKPKRWDRRWRIVMFDIPERRKTVRDALRRFMDRYGFFRLQDSVWVYPHDCEDVIALAKAHFHIGADALYIIAEFIERDKHLREHFGLPLE